MFSNETKRFTFGFNCGRIVSINEGDTMIIVRDIQDAMTMKKKLSSLARRAFNQQMARTQIIIELLDICEDLEKNVEREEKANEIEFEKLLEAS